MRWPPLVVSHLSTPRYTNLLAWVMLLVGMGCARGNPPLVVVGQVAPTPECILDPAGNLFVFEHVLDLDLATRDQIVPPSRAAYFTPLLVLNHMVNRFGFAMRYPPMADSNGLTIVGAEVEILDAQGRRLPRGLYRAQASGFVPSALEDQPGRGIAAVDLIPRSYVPILVEWFTDRSNSEGLLTVQVSVIGVSQGGVEVKSAPFVLPIRLCYGCLFVEGVLEEGERQACFPGQDQVAKVGGYSPPQPCTSSEECPSGRCLLGRCAAAE
ncbi:MAG: hypothetical protein NZM37_02730 [Sandaracinaceae bacterium]|nr:hypothetical protein [Sandaracinaceae bacterium]MDW8245100.1 hypothetical protein [Sandaracinaceae bacterium]